MKTFLLQVAETFMNNWNEKNISAPFLMLFLIGIYYIYKNEDKEKKVIFVYPILIYGVTIFNPFVHWMLIKKLGFSGRSHRFFWIIPMTFVLAWLATEVMLKIEDTFKRYVFLGILIIVCFLSGNPMYYEEHYRTKNIYKVTDEVLEISEKLTDIAGNEEKIVFVNEEHINYMIRQYDPSICLITSPSRLELLEQVTESEYKNNLEKNSYLDIVAGYFYHSYETDLEKVYGSIKSCNIEYLVLNYTERELVNLGYIVFVDSCENFNVYRVL